MKKIIVLGLVAFITSSGCFAQKEEKLPNIVYILADDLGYGGLGVYGQEKIETPNIDKLAESGMMFTQHYSGSVVCAPSRAVLLTGKHSGHVQIRGNNELRTERGDIWDYMAMLKDSTQEGQWPLLPGTTTIGNLLQGAGYKTGVVGKWGLGGPHTEGIPNKQGFDFFFGYNCQRQAHTYYPNHLYKDKNRVYLNNDTIPIHTLLDEGTDLYNAQNYNKFSSNEYTPDLIYSELTQFVDRNKDNPFFLYWATPIPHVPLQAPKEWVDKYVKKFGDEEPYNGGGIDIPYFPSRYPNATYAGMISYLDGRVGQLVQQLKDLGIYENTLIIFTSDNGPTSAGGADSEWFDSAKPFKGGLGWGKAYVHEGGIRVPMIASWPGKIQPGTSTDLISAFWDVLPTLCDVAGVKTGYSNDGISFYPTLINSSEQKEHEFLYWEYPQSGGQQAVRMGKWKGLRMNMQEGNMVIDLFNLEDDPREQNNVAGQYPDIVSQIEKIMVEQHTTPEVETFKIKGLDDL